MRSLKTKITLLTVCMIVIAMVVVTLFSVQFFRSNERKEARQLLLLLCETGERSLDYYFGSAQRTVEKVSAFVEQDLDGLDDARLQAHIERASRYFGEVIGRISGALTYYYRIDPALSDTVKGFWFTCLDGEDFVEHEVTDITLYDTEDTSKLVWFTVPKHTGQPIWLPPYVTDNLDVRVISYNIPIFFERRFVGVIGIEIDCLTMAEQVESIRLYKNGYAFLSDAEGQLFFHPRIDVTALTPETMPAVPDGALSENTFLRYTFEGVERQAVWLPLDNGMRLNVTVPISETDGNWGPLTQRIVIASVCALAVMALLAWLWAGRASKPFRELVDTAERVEMGDYDVKPEATGTDEADRIAGALRRLAERLGDPSRRQTVDDLTSVKNKTAFSAAVEVLQRRVEGGEGLTFGIAMFHCDDLKRINDQCGQDKGDMYLKNTCQLICDVFNHSPVYRTGGDEFAVILQNDDLNNRDALVTQLEAERQKRSAATQNPWQQVLFTMGLAVYDPQLDHAAVDAVHRAERLMVENKRARRAGK